MEVGAVVIAVLALFVALAAFFRAGAGGGIRRYTIRGVVFISNSCTGNLTDIPDEILVTAQLNDGAGNQSGGQDRVRLRASGIFSKRGGYSITVVWGPGFAAPVEWDRPWATLLNKGDICRAITSGCPAGFTCLNTRPFSSPPPPPVVPFVDPDTDFDVDLDCGCIRLAKPTSPPGGP